jgi:hypothetical protein
MTGWVEFFRTVRPAGRAVPDASRPPIGPYVMTRDPRPDEEVASMSYPHVAPTTPDPYYLNHLLHCRPCGVALRPAFSSSGQRHYDCPLGDCGRTSVPAEQAEQQVWSRFASLNEQAARQVPLDQRQGALIAVLSRVTVGPRPDDLEYDWRD